MHPEKTEEGTECVFVCYLVFASFVSPYLGMHCVLTPPIPHGSEHSKTIFRARAFTY